MACYWLAYNYSYSLLISDSVLVKPEGKAEVLTDKCIKKYSEISYSLEAENDTPKKDVKEGKQEVKMESNPRSAQRKEEKNSKTQSLIHVFQRANKQKINDENIKRNSKKRESKKSKNDFKKEKRNPNLKLESTQNLINQLLIIQGIWFVERSLLTLTNSLF
jgi:hypothetical protein